MRVTARIPRSPRPPRRPSVAAVAAASFATSVSQKPTTRPRRGPRAECATYWTMFDDAFWSTCSAQSSRNTPFGTAPSSVSEDPGVPKSRASLMATTRPVMTSRPSNTSPNVPSPTLRVATYRSRGDNSSTAPSPDSALASSSSSSSSQSKSTLASS